MKVSIIDWHRLCAWIKHVKQNWIDGPELVKPLIARLSRAQTCDPGAIPSDVVTMDSLVSVRELKTDKLSTYRLAYPDSVDESAGCVSVLTEFGANLLGASVGECLDQPWPSGVCAVQIDSIAYQPEREQYSLHS